MYPQASWFAAGRDRPDVVVLASVNRPRVRAELDKIERILARSANIIAVDEDESFDFSQSSVDLCVVLGGDGSILSAARRMGLDQKPVIGVNLGRLGFLAALSEDELGSVWPEVCAAKYPVDEHVMLQCAIHRAADGTVDGTADGTVDGAAASQSPQPWFTPTLSPQHPLALNEAAILGGPPFSMLQIDLYVDGELASTYSCDGLIISTPVGSTAHNLSAGGPILQRRLQAVVISPLSPHTLTMRPVVDRADRLFEMVLRQGHESVSAVFDGRVLGRLAEGDRYRVSKAPVSFKMISIPDKGGYRTLREKLGWGGNPREPKCK
ncbi:MAG: NAD(+)/NADH kinase [Planctomycetales bacterium]|nr:NAD(+)/NADH kinase [Planctomycetales bacterium]